MRWLLLLPVVCNLCYFVTFATLVFAKSEEGAKGLANSDIIPSSHVHETGNDNEKRGAARFLQWIWRTRIVPYVLDASLSAEAKQNIREAINEYENKSCIRFRPIARSSNKPKIFFHSLKYIRGCWVMFGKSWKKEQLLRIAPACQTDTKAGVMRDLMISLGFYHEHNRYDRGEYIKINGSNIIDGKASKFNKVEFRRQRLFGLPYDYNSITHFGAYRYAKDPRYPVIMKRTESGGPLGNKIGFSVTDIKRLNIQYDCKTSSETNSWSSWSAYSQCYFWGRGFSNKKRSQRFCFKEDLSLCPGADRNGIQKREKVCSGELKTGSTVCNTKHTSWRFVFRAPMKSLDYHRMKCGYGFVLNMFQLEFENKGRYGGRIRYKYKCCSIGLASYCTNKPMISVWKGSPFDRTYNLAKITAFCGWLDGSNGFISDMRVEHTPDNRRFRYNYKCCQEAEAYHHKSSCVNKVTPYTYDGNGKSYYLDRQTVQCATGHALSYYQLERAKGRKLRYRYLCCKIGV